MVFSDMPPYKPGTPILESGWDTLVKDNINFLGNPPSARLRASSNPGGYAYATVGASSWTTLKWNMPGTLSEVWDVNSIHDPSTDNGSRLTIQDKGFYLIGGFVEWEAYSGTKGMRIALNGATTNPVVECYEPGVNVNNYGLSGQSLYLCNPGDYLTIEAWNGSGTSRYVYAFYARTPIFYAHWLGGA